MGRCIENIGRLAVSMSLVACASPDRENPLDPARATRIEMSNPVFEDGSILIQWRYISDGDGLKEFEVRKVVTEGDIFPALGAQTETIFSGSMSREVPAFTETIEVGRAPASLSASADWQTGTYRDTSVIVGARVLYQVVALDGAGARLSSATAAIEIEGTRFKLPVADHRLLNIQLTWENTPATAVGFEVRRTPDGGTAVTVFSTDDSTVRRFDDNDLSGNTVYKYELITHLTGGSSITSSSVEAGVFIYAGTRGTEEVSAGSRLGLAGNKAVLMEPGSLTLWNAIKVIRDRPVAESNPPLSLPEFDPSTGSVTGSHFAMTGLQFVVAGLTATTGEVAFSAFGYLQSVLTRRDAGTARWPARGATRTGLTALFPAYWLGENGWLLFAGSAIRRLGDDYAEIEQIEITTGEPIDIEFNAGAFWIAYPNRLLKANGFRLEDIVAWDEVALPEAMTITAISRFDTDRIVVLDGVNARIYLLDGDGSVVLSWAAEGDRLEQGDIGLGDISQEPGQAVLVSDGLGIVHTYNSEVIPLSIN